MDRRCTADSEGGSTLWWHARLCNLQQLAERLITQSVVTFLPSSGRMETELSQRCLKGLQVDFGAEGLNDLYRADPFDENNNKDGYIRLSIADNILIRDLLLHRFRSIQWSDFDDNELLFYPNPGGDISVRKTFAEFINFFTIPNSTHPVSADQVLSVAGTTMVCDLLSQVLFDEDDVLLTYSPYYHRFPNDFSDRGLVEIVDVPLDFSDTSAVALEVAAFEAKLQTVKKEGKQVRAVLIVNPRNPDAGYFPLDELRPLVEWAVKEHSLYVILDEIYDQVVYDPDPKAPFESAIRLFDQDPSLDRNKLIWMSGLSKNFSLPGLRTAFMYTTNREVRAATRRFLMCQGPNAVTDFIVKELLGDIHWLKDVFLPESRRLLRQARDRVLAWLERFRTASGKTVRWIHPRAGFFLMIDFSAFLTENSFDAEEKLHHNFLSHRVMLLRGRHSEMNTPGWFRLVFSGRPWPEVEEALRRIAQALKVNMNKEQP